MTGYSNATWGSPVQSFGGGSDAFAVKLNSSGVLTWSTFLGGTGIDTGTGIALDGSNVFVAGTSDTTWGSPKSAFGAGSTAAFAARLSSSGGRNWNTFLGGSGSSSAAGIATDASGIVYVVGSSTATWGSPLQSFGGVQDAFAARLKNDGVLVWSTFLGGGGVDSGNAIVADANANLYVSGSSSATWGAPVRPFGGATDSFAARLVGSGVLLWNTFLGGSGTDTAAGLHVDGGGALYLSGTSDTSWGAPIWAYTGGQDAVAAKMASTGNLVWNTFLGGAGDDVGYGISGDASGNVYAAGASTATWGSPLRAFGSPGQYDAFVAQLPPLSSGSVVATALVSAKSNATVPPANGGLSYDGAVVAQIGNPSLAFGSGPNNGTFTSFFDLDTFATDNTNIRGLHYVSRTTVVGTTNPVALERGDILFTTSSDETLGGLSTTTNDVVRFRPTVPGNYSSGTFSLLLRSPGNTGKHIRDFALVESAVTVGGVDLAAGDFLITFSSATYDRDVQRFQPTTMGTTPTGGTLSLLIDGDGSGANFSDQIGGLDLVSTPTTIGGVELVPGQLLLSFQGSGPVGSNALEVTEFDVARFTATATGLSTSGYADMFLRGADVGLSAGGEDVDALSIAFEANTAPALDASKSPVLNPIVEDAGAPSGAVGTSVAALVDFDTPSGQVDNVTDNDPGALLGIAVTSADTVNGTWFYTIDNGASWIPLDAVSGASARQLVASVGTRLYFLPNANYNGTLTAAITFRAWDRTNGGSNGTFGDTTTNGGLTSYSSATDTARLVVTAVADTPAVSGAVTNEDVQSSSGLVISRNVADGAEVTHFKVTGISNGTLYKNDGTTVITGGSFITFAEGSAGLKFTPAVNFNGSAGFTVQASTSNLDAGLGGAPVNASITVTAVADTPAVSGAVTNEDVQSSSGLVISRNVVDGAEVTHFKVTAISNGTLYKNDGTTVITGGSFITFAEGSAGLKFTPAVNFNGSAGFTVQASTSNLDAGLGGTPVNASITVTAVADTPAVSGAVTNEDVQSSSGLVISRNVADGAEVTHFKVTGISNGTLYKNDGTTVITGGSFITFAEGSAGLKFTPTVNFNGSAGFTVQASTSNLDAGLGGTPVNASITVTAVADTPAVSGAVTNEDVQSSSGLVISRNVADGAEVTHFKVTAITNGTLYKNDGTTVITGGSFITFAEGSAGLKFTPAVNFNGSAGFTVQASTSNLDAGLGGTPVNASITVTAVADTPAVSGAVTNEDVQSSSGLVISRNVVDGAEVTHFKVTAITNGTLYKNDGTTVITGGSFITFAEGSAGLKFTPAVNFNGSAGFTVQASTSNLDAGLGGTPVNASITVTAVNDAPTLANGSLEPVPKNPVTNDGQTITAIFAGKFGDVDAGSSFTGLAVVGNAASPVTQGVWQYSSNAGTDWAAIGAVGDSTALVLSTSPLVRFVPVADYEGIPAPLLVRALDNTYGGGFSSTGVTETRVTLDTTSNGGSTPIAAATTTLSTRILPSGIAVTTVDDVVDGDTSSLSALAASRGPDGEVSLREAIIAANSTPDLNEISFEIAGGGLKTITLASALPPITDPIEIDGYSQPGATVNSLQVGDDAVLLIELDGSTAGSSSGLTLAAGSAGSTIRGLVLNRFALDGIVIGSPNNLVVGNFIGTNAAGTADLGNLGNGITVAGDGNTIGRASILGAFDRNLISGNDGHSIAVQPGYLGTTIQGNYVGTDAAGFAAVPNGQAAASGSGAILIEGATSTVGGANVGEGNLISGNAHGGLTLASSGNTVQGNLIGTDAGGVAALSNQGDGITISGASGAANLVGGIGTGEGNTIAFNGGIGVDLAVGSGAGNRIETNSIFANGGLGIDLGGDDVTPNDVGDPDGGPNDLKNFPILTEAFARGGQVVISGTYNSLAVVRTYRVEFFASAVPVPGADLSGHGEGQRYLGFADIATDAAGDASFSTTLSAGVSAGEIVTATVTDPGLNDTSEFGPNVAAIDNHAPVLSPVSPVLAAVTEDEVANAGQTVASILAGSATDADAGDPLGIAVESLSNGNGTWEYSLDGGTSWLAITGVAETTALLLRADDRVRFVPNELNGTVASFGYRAWDETAGTAGAKVDASSSGGQSAFSAATDIATITVTPANDAPLLGSASLAAIDEDTASNDGATLSSLFSGKFSDVDAGSSLSGIAVVGNAASALSEGTWQYSTNGGSDWFPIGAVGDDSTALALSVASRVRFVPVTDYNGTPTSLVVRGVDDSYAGGFSSTGAGETRITLDTSARGDATAIAASVANISTSVSAENDPPEVSVTGAPLDYTENDPATAVDPGLTVVDVDDASSVSAVVRVTGNYVPGEDVLSFVDTVSISGSWNALDGSLTLSGPDTVAAFEAALQAVRYVNTNDDPSVASRTISFTVFDGTADSVAAFRTITISAENDPPEVSVTGAPLDYTENDPATAVDPGLTVVDVDDASSVSAVVRVTGNYVPGEDVLSFVDTVSISGSWNALDGSLTLSGPDTVAAFEAALQAVRYVNTNDDPSVASRTISFTVFDGTADSVAAFRTITISAENDPPVLATNNGATGDEGQAVVIDAAMLTVTDGDASPAQLVFMVGSIPSYGVLRLGSTPLHTNETFTQADIDAGSISYRNDGSESNSDSFSFTVSDGAGGTIGSTIFSITVSPVNDKPVAADESDSLAEDGLPLDVDLTALVSDAETDAADLTYEIVAGPLAAAGTLLPSAVNGVLTFDPAPNFNGLASFTYKVTDRGDPDNCGTPGPACADVKTSATQTFSITVSPVNDGPTAAGGSAAMAEDGTPIDVDLSALVSDVETADANLDYQIVAGPAPAEGTLVAAAPNGTFTFTPAADFNGTSSFTFNVTDRGDPDNCGVVGPNCTAAKSSPTRTFTITVDPGNDGPTAADGSDSMAEDGTAIVGRPASARDGSRDGRCEPRLPDRDRPCACGGHARRRGTEWSVHVHADGRLQRTGVVHLQGQRSR